MGLTEPHLLEGLAYLQYFLGILSALSQYFLGSPYGRYSLHWPGPRLPSRASWFLQELPSLVWPLWECIGASSPRLHSWPNRLLLAMFILHYGHRFMLSFSLVLLEFFTQLKQMTDQTFYLRRSLVFPFLIRGGKAMPFYVFAMAGIFCVYNGYLQCRYLSTYAVYSDDWVTQPCFLTGFALWLTGLLINIHSDQILRNLRKPEESGYRIPRGGLFEYVTAANYFGEVVEWCGFALASWSRPGMAFAFFTFCVLSARAKNHHRWYLEKFEDYPKLRKIIIPFLL